MNEFRASNKMALFDLSVWEESLWRPVWLQVSIPHGIWDGQIGTGTGFSLEYFGLPCQYHSTKAPVLPTGNNIK